MEIKSPLPSREVDIPDVSSKTEETTDRTDLGQEEIKTKTIKGGLPLAGKLKPGLVVLAILLLIGAVIGGFQLLKGKEIVSGKEVVINYWGLWEEESVMAGIISKFEEKNPKIKINYQKQNKENYRTRLEARLEKGEGAPDIFRFHSSWTEIIGDRLENVPGSVSRNLKMDEDFFDCYKKDLKIGGNYKGIPLMYDGLVLFYNKDLLDASGKQIPKTWWGLSNTASELTVRDSTGEITVAGVAMGTTGNVDHWQDIVGLMMKQNGVKLNELDAVNIKKIKDVIDFYRFFGQKQKWNVWSDKLPTSTQAFAMGKTVFYFGPSWRIFEISYLNPQLNWGTAKVPQLPTVEGLEPAMIESGEVDAKLTDINWASYWVEGVWKNSANKEYAWKFLEFLASEEGLADFYLAASQVRQFGEIYPRKSMASKLSENGKLTTFVETADKSISGWPSSRTWDDGVNDELSKYIEASINEMAWDEENEAALFSGISRVVDLYKIK